MVLRLSPEDRRVGDERHLARVASLRRYAEVDVADDAGTVVLAEEHGGDAVLQLLLPDVEGIWVLGGDLPASVAALFHVCASNAAYYTTTRRQKTNPRQKPSAGAVESQPSAANCLFHSSGGITIRSFSGKPALIIATAKSTAFVGALASAVKFRYNTYCSFVPAK